ncbi:imidazole glycerol phosphate synthase subunit HisF [Striga asiatica]|uniref:Imidazole glycerol phosphate synthase subunit HisF n=1 Tax=Striga asiatica TaxID=4170 RepID=A0A5A7PBU6_STRAF|nr:imidazole glycerol phosphate synthase subunit HisF [Striga asiatica]
MTVNGTTTEMVLLDIWTRWSTVTEMVGASIYGGFRIGGVFKTVVVTSAGGRCDGENMAAFRRDSVRLNSSALACVKLWADVDGGRFSNLVILARVRRRRRAVADRRENWGGG